MFLAAKEVLNIIAGLGSFAKEFLKEAGRGGKVFSHFEDVKNGEGKSYKQ